MRGGTRDRNLPANLKLRAPGPKYDQEEMRQAFRLIEQHYHLQLIEAGGAGVCFDIFCGTGSPEGVVTAAPDSLYVQTDAATTSHPYWVKISGVGNTGWRGWVGLRGAGTASIRVGDAATATSTNSQAYGDDSHATAQDAIAVGRTTSNNRDMINIGRGNTTPTVAPVTTQLKQIVIGSDNTMTDTEDAGVTNHGRGGLRDITIGANNTIDHSDFGEPIQLVGGNNVVKGDALVVVGFDMVLEAQGTNHSVLTGDCTYGVAIGNECVGFADCFVAAGYQATVFGTGAVAIGPHTKAGTDDRNIHTTALGRRAKAFNDYSTALGAEASVSFDYSVGLGAAANPSQANELCIGATARLIQYIRFNEIRAGVSPGSNTSAVDVTFMGSRGTGSGQPGHFIFQIAQAGASSSTRQSSRTQARITDKGVSVESCFAVPVLAVTADTTLAATHYTVLVNSASAHTITLPTAASAFANGSGRIYIVKQIGAGVVTLAGNGAENIDTANTFVFRSQYDTVHVQSDGTQWWIVEKIVAPVSGTAVLVGGTVTVTTAKVTATSRIMLTAQVLGGTQGMLSVGTVTAGTSFVINSSNAADTSTVGWLITEP